MKKACSAFTPSTCLRMSGRNQSAAAQSVCFGEKSKDAENEEPETGLRILSTSDLQADQSTSTQTGRLVSAAVTHIPACPPASPSPAVKGSRRCL